MNRTKKLSFRARRGKGGVALAWATDAIQRFGARTDASVARMLAGSATDADQITVRRYLEMAEEQVRKAQS